MCCFISSLTTFKAICKYVSDGSYPCIKLTIQIGQMSDGLHISWLWRSSKGQRVEADKAFVTLSKHGSQVGISPDKVTQAWYPCMCRMISTNMFYWIWQEALMPLCETSIKQQLWLKLTSSLCELLLKNAWMICLLFCLFIAIWKIIHKAASMELAESKWTWILIEWTSRHLTSKSWTFATSSICWLQSMRNIVCSLVASLCKEIAKSSSFS